MTVQAMVFMKKPLERAFERWARFVAGTRIVLAATFVPVMLVGFIIAPRTRLVTGAAIVVLSVLVMRHFWTKGIAEEEATSQDRGENGGSWLLGLDGRHVADLRAINGTIVVFQLLGAVLSGWFFREQVPLSLLAGAACSAVVGLGFGVLVDRGRSNAWARATILVRSFYVASGIAVTLAGVSLILTL